MTPDEDDIVVEFKQRTIDSMIYIRCHCGEEFSAGGPTAQAAYEAWNREHRCPWTLKAGRPGDE